MALTRELQDHGLPRDDDMETIKTPYDQYKRNLLQDLNRHAAVVLEGRRVGQSLRLCNDLVQVKYLFFSSWQGQINTEEGQIRNAVIYLLTALGLQCTDVDVGDARILAAALTKFPCGTFIEITNPNMGTFNGIVLDTGGAMRTAYKNGTIWMDLAFTSETSNGIHNSTSTNVKYKVKRWGW